jgi:hypothetical protein
LHCWSVLQKKIDSPGSAKRDEFSKHKETFQAKVNEFVKEAFSVKLEFWKAANLSAKGYHY